MAKAVPYFLVRADDNESSAALLSGDFARVT